MIMNDKPVRSAVGRATLKRFCASANDHRRDLRQPWSCTEGVGATDGSILICIPGPGAERYRPAVGPMTDVISRFDLKYKAAHARTAVSDLALPHDHPCDCCCASGAVIVSACTECSGKGLFTHGSHKYACKHCSGSGMHRSPAARTALKHPARSTCPICKGLGDLSTDLPVPVFGGFIRKRYLLLLRALKGCELHAPAGSSTDAYPFRFKGGRGWVMPCSPT